MEKVKVLLADDHAIVRAGIRNALSGLSNLEFIGEVDDGPSLAAALSQNPPDFLVIDVTMPGFDPIATIRQIRTGNPDMKILVVSAYDDDVYVQGLLAAGVNGYHLKDQSLSDLRLAIQRILEGKRWISSRLVDKLVHHNQEQVTAPILTTRQYDILQLLQQGLDNQAIARHMSLSVKTVENHLTRLYRQLNVQSRLEAVNYVMEHPKVLGLPGQVAAILPTLAPDGLTPAEITILLVDDNARYRQQLRRMAGNACPQAVIYEAKNIQEAMHLTQQVMPKLILVDVVLGDEDGIRCARRIKVAAPTSRIILMSAYPDREFRRLGLEAGAVAFLDKKDLDMATLRQVVNDMII